MQIFSFFFNANIFEFCMQLFPDNRSFGMGMMIYSCITPTAQSREHDTICVLKLVLLWLLFSV